MQKKYFCEISIFYEIEIHNNILLSIIKNDNYYL